MRLPPQVPRQSPLLDRAGRRLPARIGATVVVRHGEGFTLRRDDTTGPKGQRPRYMVRFLAGEFGTITAYDPDWYRHYTVVLPPHPDWPEDGEREFMFERDDFIVCPKDITPNTSAMDRHWRGYVYGPGY